MMRRLTTSLYQRWRALSLSAKLIYPLVGLMLASLLLGVLAFGIGTARTRSQLLAQQTTEDIRRVREALLARESDVATAASLLANDTVVTEVLNESGTSALEALNSRAVVMRDRLTLDLVQLYDLSYEARANLLLSNLYRQSSLLAETKGDGSAVLAVDGHFLLVHRAAVRNDQGYVVTGLDLDAELHRIAKEYRLLSDIGLETDGMRIGTRDCIPFDAGDGQSGVHWVGSEDIDLGATPFRLVISRHSQDTLRVTRAGLTVMVATFLVTTLMLIVLAVFGVNLIVRPVRVLAHSATQIAGGDLTTSTEIEALGADSPANTADEIHILADSFGHMLGELRSVYASLEDKVAARTQELAEAEERYRRFFNEDLAGAFVCSRDGLILTCNPAFARIFGFGSPAHAEGSYIDRLFPTQDDLAAFWDLLGERRVLEYHEGELRDLDGRPVYVVQNIICEFDEQGDIERIRGFIFDDSDRKTLEQQLRQSQKMEAIGRLAGGVAHDFNNLLTVIIGYSQLVQRIMEASPNGMTYAELPIAEIETIERAGDKASALTRQLLAFSRKQVLQPKVLDLNGAVDGLSKMLERLIGEDIELVTALDGDLGRVYVDPSQVEQVIMNLAVNSRDAMPQGGKLTIETRNVYLDANYASQHLEVRPGAYVELAVSDTGLGMDRETLDHLFEPFFTTKANGTGLGLSTVYGIIKQSGGHVSVYSELDRGATFKVYLPRVGAGIEGDKDAAASSVMPLGSETILLVEDEDMVRDLARRILVNRGYRVHAANGGHEALELVPELMGTIDLVITDVVMPGMSGRELVDILHSIDPALRVLFMSGYTDAAIVNHGVLAPDTDFISKPFAPAELCQKVREVLSQTRVTGKGAGGMSPQSIEPRHAIPS